VPTGQPVWPGWTGIQPLDQQGGVFPPVGVFPADFYFYKFAGYEEAMRTPIANAVYTLKQYGENVGVGVSDMNGEVHIAVYQPGVYQLEELSAPEGYYRDTDVYELVVDGNGLMTIGGSDAKGIGFVSPSA
jgi:hypothetical protein